MNNLGVISDVKDPSTYVAGQENIDMEPEKEESQEEKKRLKMTNMMYARSLTIADLPLINRVVRNYINRLVGENAPLWKKESAYNQWQDEEYDDEKWSRARLEMSSKHFVFG